MLAKSNIAYVSIMLRTPTSDYTVLCYSKQWQDWSFVGGHVKAHEEYDWRLAAIREAEEELHLKHGSDFDILTDVQYMTLPTRLSKKTGVLTAYEVGVYNLVFLKDPSAFIASTWKSTELKLFNLDKLRTYDKVANVIFQVQEKVKIFDKVSWEYHNVVQSYSL